MLFIARPDVKSVHALADLLETMEVAADEMLDQRLAPRDAAATDDAAITSHLAALRQFAARVRELELVIAVKLGQARDRARQVSRSDWRLRPIMMLFTTGTQGLADQLAAHADRDSIRFDAGDQIFPFLRSRELVPPLSTHYDGSTELLVTDSYRMLGLSKLRDLLENCEATLNALDSHYDLYDWQEDAEETSEDCEEVVAALPEGQPASVPEPAVAPEPVPAPAASAAEIPATNWGETLESPVAATAPEGQATPPKGVAAEAAPPETASAETAAVAEPEPTPEAIKAVQAASEDGLKGLSERLADMQAAAAPEPAAAGVEVAA